MIEPKHEVSITRQAELLGISRAAVYYVPRPVSEADPVLMRRIDELHLEYPLRGPARCAICSGRKASMRAASPSAR
jgi:putative transposase